MAKADQLAIEVHYVPLSLNELGERRALLRTLLLRGALRVVHQQLSLQPETRKAEPAEFVQK